MPDISMCQNKSCPKKCMCYRFTAKPSEYWQSYGAFDGGEDCKYFWIDEYAAKKSSIVWSNKD